MFIELYLVLYMDRNLLDIIKVGDIFTNLTYKEIHSLGIKMVSKNLFFHIRDGFDSSKPVAVVMSFDDFLKDN